MKTVHFLCFTKKILLWRNRYEQSVRTQTMKIVMYTMEPRLRVSPRHGGNHRKWKNV